MLLARVVLGIGCSGVGACAAGEMSYDPADPGPPGVKTPRPGSAEECRARGDRPAPGRAAVEEVAEEDVILVRYSATPDEEPCETLDIQFRKRGEMLVGEPGRQVELVWSGERAVDRAAEVRLLVKDAAMTLPSSLERRGSRVRISTYLPTSALARYGRDDRPALEFSTHRIKLSDFQIGILQRFVRHLPFHDTFAPATSLATDAPAPPARSAPDPAAGAGWFCVEAEAKQGRRQKRASSCHRSAAACEEARSALRAGMDRPASACPHGPRCATGGDPVRRLGQSCFYRPSQCNEERERHGANRRAADRSLRPGADRRAAGRSLLRGRVDCPLSTHRFSFGSTFARARRDEWIAFQRCLCSCAAAGSTRRSLAAISRTSLW